MNAFFRKLFGKTSKEHSAPASLTSRGYHSSIQAGSESSTRAQLVQVVMRDLLRKSGIPPEWIVCQPQVINSRSRGQGIFVRLSVKHWDDRLMRYAFAFQKALLTEIVGFEPQAAEWLHGIAWQLEVATSCPHTELPEKAFWLAVPAPALTKTIAGTRRPLVAPIAAVAPRAAIPQAPVAAAQATFGAPITSAPVAKSSLPLSVPETSTAENDAKQDLERLFAIRDKELANHAANNSLPRGYESTEPSPLARN